MKNSSAHTKVREGGDGALGTRAQISLQPLGETLVEQVLTLQHGERTHAGAGEKREEKRAAEQNCYVLTVSLMHQIQAEESEVKMSLGKTRTG